MWPRVLHPALSTSFCIMLLCFSYIGLLSKPWVCNILHATILFSEPIPVMKNSPPFLLPESFYPMGRIQLVLISVSTFAIHSHKLTVVSFERLHEIYNYYGLMYAYISSSDLNIYLYWLGSCLSIYYYISKAWSLQSIEECVLDGRMDKGWMGGWSNV